MVRSVSRPLPGLFLYIPSSALYACRGDILGVHRKTLRPLRFTSSRVKITTGIDELEE